MRNMSSSGPRVPSSEKSLTVMCFLFTVGITSAWFSLLQEKYLQLMSLGFLTWCERGTGQRWAAPMESGWSWACCRQIFLLARWVSMGCTGDQEGRPGHKALSRDGSLSLSWAPPLCFSHHPYSPLLIFCARGYRTSRNQFPGKQGKAEHLTMR